MKKHRILFLLLALVMLFGLVTACEDTEELDVPDEPVDPPSVVTPPVTPPPVLPENTGETLIVGTPDMLGSFIEGWGSNLQDQSIKVLTGGFHGTVYVTDTGQLAINPTIVKDHSVTTDGAGNKTYTWTLHEDLKWNNGETITAKDYVASLLFYAGPVLTSQHGTSYTGYGLIGYDDYKRGFKLIDDGEGTQSVGDAVETFAAVKLLDEFIFSMTIEAKELPYFWELEYVNAYPVYSAGWFPGIDITSGATGSSFSGDITAAAEAVAYEERFAPTVTCGPYIFESFEEGKTVTLRRNPHFKGDQDGDTPFFEKIVQVEIPSESNIDLVISGDVDLIVGNIDYAKIEGLRASGAAQIHSFERAGYTFIAFPCDWGVTSDENVRWAIAHILDREAIIDKVLYGNADLVNAAFGLAEWTYQSRQAQLTSRLTPIVFDLDKANEYLDQTEWIYESNGTTRFNPDNANAEGTYMRHNSNGEKLVVRHLSAFLSIGGAIEDEVYANAPLVGMGYELDHGEYEDLLDHFYDGYLLPDADRFYNAFNLGANFTHVDDKWLSYHSDLLGTWQNAHQLSDPQLDEIMVSMRRLNPSQTEEYANHWVDFQVRWQQILPQIPLFSATNFNIFNSNVTGVSTNHYQSYHDVICKIAKSS